MWKVKQIFDGEYGCEEREPGEKEQYLVVLVNENGEEQSFPATEDWIGAMEKLSAHTLMRIIISKPVKKDCPYRKIVVEKKKMAIRQPNIQRNRYSMRTLKQKDCRDF